jgi:hypothetical protein
MVAVNKIENGPAKKFLGTFPGKDFDSRRIHEKKPELRSNNYSVRRQINQSPVALLALSDGFENSYLFVHGPLPFRVPHEKTSMVRVSGNTATTGYNGRHRSTESCGTTTLKPFVILEKNFSAP